jgi:hypothetical protein
VRPRLAIWPDQGSAGDDAVKVSGSAPVVVRLPVSPAAPAEVSDGDALDNCRGAGCPHGHVDGLHHALVVTLPVFDIEDIALTGSRAARPAKNLTPAGWRLCVAAIRQG